jgi:hypothetical protein
LLILLFFELLLAVGVGRIAPLPQPAALEWQQHPTVETREAFDLEKRTNECGRWLFSGGLFPVLAAATMLVYWRTKDDSLWLILRRFGTFLALFLVLFPGLLIGSLVSGAAIVGMRAESGFSALAEKDQNLGGSYCRAFAGIFFVGAVWVSGLASASIAFSGILPWCQRRPASERVPANHMTETPRKISQS